MSTRPAPMVATLELESTPGRTHTVHVDVEHGMTTTPRAKRAIMDAMRAGRVPVTTWTLESVDPDHGYASEHRPVTRHTFTRA